MANVAVIAAQTAPPVAPRAFVPPVVPRDRPVPAVLPDRSGSGEAAARFSTLARERAQQAQPPAGPTAAEEARASVPFLAQWFGQDAALPDRLLPPDDFQRHTAIAAYRRSQAALAEAPLVFGASEIVSAALGQRVDLVG